MNAASEPIRAAVDPVETWTRPSDGAATFRYVDIGSVDRDSKSVVDVADLPVKEAPSRARQLLRANDVLVSTVRPNLNAVAMVPAELDGAVGSTGFTVLRAKPKRLLPRYLFHWVRSPMFVTDMVRKATGASYPAISDRIVMESAIPMPGVDEQSRIADILDKVDAIRRKRKQAIALTEDLLRSAFLDMFGDPVTNSKGWPVRPLSRVVREGTIVTYGIVQAGPDVDDGVPYIRTGDIKNDCILTQGLRRTSPAIAARFRRSEVRAGDLVMSIRATVGTVAVVPAELDGANLTQGTARIAPGDDVTQEFLFHHLRASGMQRWFQSQVKGVTFKEITLGTLRTAPVMVPPKGAQEEFSAICGLVRRVRQAQASCGEGADDLFGALVAQSFRGAQC